MLTISATLLEWISQAGYVPFHRAQAPPPASASPPPRYYECSLCETISFPRLDAWARRGRHDPDPHVQLLRPDGPPGRRPLRAIAVRKIGKASCRERV